MGQSTEDIEAKLAAFVDGDLDAAGREEIEKHLQANPQHRKLLDDLMRGRDLLRDLPRESAPPEILDSIQSHLERRLLLDEHSADSVGGIGTGGARRYMAVAAVLLLTGTLGLVIYSVLPNSKNSSDLAAVLAKPEVPITEPAAALPETRVARSESPRVGVDEAARELAAAGAVEAIRGAAGGTGIALGSELGRGVEPDVSHPAAVAGGPIASAVAPAAASVAPVIILATDDRPGTEKDLLTVLTDQQVAYEQVASSSSGARRLAEASPTAAEGESIFVAKKVTRAQYQAIDQALNAPSRARKELVAQDTQQQYQAFRRSRADGKDDFPRAADQDKLAASGEAVAKADAAKAGSAVAQEEKAAGSQPGTAGGPTQVATPGAGPLADHSLDLIAPGDKLKIELPSMVQSNIAGAQTIEVAADGSIQVPPLEPIVVAGLTADGVREKLAAIVGDNKAGPAGTVTVQKQRANEEADDAALTDVVIVVRQTNHADAAAPATQPAATGSALPLTPTTAPAVVAPIEATPAPATAPSTQPGN